MTDKKEPHHHSHEHHHARSRGASVSSIISLFLAMLPLLLLIPAFVLATHSAAGNDWSWRDMYDPSASDAVLIGQERRTPFSNCVLSAQTVTTNTTTNGTTTNTDSGGGEGDQNGTDVTQTTVFVEVCTRVTTPSGLCDANATGATRSSSAFFCQHLSLSARLLYAGCALAGASLVLSLLLTAGTVPQILAGSEGGPGGGGAALGLAALLTALVSGLGALGLGLGTLLGAHALVVLQFPNGDFFSTGISGTGDPTLFNHAGPWMMGASVGRSAAAAVLAAVASYCVALLWDMPSVGGSRRAAAASVPDHHAHAHHHHSPASAVVAQED